MVFLMKKKNKRDNDLYIFICDICVIYMEVKENICIVKKIFYYL